jgi:2-methylcitrate dehydratase PrpD
MHELTNRISAEIDPALSGGSIEPTRVRIKTKGGEVFVKQVDVPLGSPQKPFGQADIKRKLQDCNSVSIKPLPDEALEKLIETIQRLEEFEDLGPVLSTLFKG